MKRCVGLLILSFGIARLSMAQEFPKPTPTGEKALDELIERCIAAGGLTRVEGPRAGTSAPAPGDEANLRIAAEQVRVILTPELFDALIARWMVSEGESTAAVVALLRVAGEVANDLRALAFASLFSGVQAGQTDQAIAFYEDAIRRFEALKERAWQATIYQQTGLILQGKGELALALLAYLKSLEIRRAALGDRHTDVADSYNNIATIYQARGDHAQALEMYLKALEIRRAALGDRHTDVGQSYHNIANLYQAQGDHVQALEMYLKALEISRAVLGEQHPDVADSYYGIAIIYHARGEHDRALEMHLKAMETRRAVLGERHVKVGHSYIGIGEIYRGRGENAHALEMYLKALEIGRAALGDQHLDIAASYNNIGLVYHAQGEYARALEAHLKALNISRVVLGDRHTDVADSYHNIAMVYHALGEHSHALELYLKSSEIRRTALGDRHPDVAKSYNNIAAVYGAQGEHDRALEMYLKASEISRAALGDRHTDVADSYYGIGEVYLAHGEQARALEMYLKALEIRRAALGEKHLRVAASYDNIAGVYRDQAEHAHALEMYRKALEIRRAALGDRHNEVAESYNNIAYIYLAQADPSHALEMYDNALAALGLGVKPTEGRTASRDSPSATPSPLGSAIFLRRGRLSEFRAGTDPAAGLAAALDNYRAAAHALDRLREATSRDEDKVRRGEDVSEVFPYAIGDLSRLAAASGRPDPLREAFSFAERGAARVFLEELGRSHASAGDRIAPAMLADEARLAAEIREVDGRIAREQDKPFDKRDRDVVERLFGDRNKAEEAWSAVVAQMELDSPQYAALKRPRPCSIDEARACLVEDEVALTYVLGSEASYLLVVSPRDDPANAGIAVHKLPPTGELAEAVAALTRQRTLEDADATRERGEAAYKILMAPAAEAIAGKRLVIVPGGVLGQLPFELLAEPDGAAGSRFLVQGHSIRYAPSLTALHMIRRWEGERPEVGKMLWALGDPVYSPADSRMGHAGEPSADSIQLASRLRGGERGTAFERLEGTGREVDRLAGLLGSTAGERLTGPDATEAAVKRLSSDGTLTRYRYIHFACHGVLGTGKDAQPGLVLTQVGNPEGQDGYLRMDEVTDLRLNADLVTLSACQTGQGKVFRAEGVSGLARAFLYAGSRGVLCSLWQVDDSATADLMSDLYAGLKAGRSSADALRAAQLTMIEAGEPPLHWAPFVLIGR